MKRYIIEVPEEITVDNIGVALEGVVDYTTIEETTMKSQAEIEARKTQISQEVNDRRKTDSSLEVLDTAYMYVEASTKIGALNWVLGK